jgi:P-type Cu2+ transporter
MSADPKPGAPAVAAPLQRTVVEVRGLHWATSKAVIERVLSQRPGVAVVEANPVAQTATVSFDPSVTSVEQISGWVRDCGYHCRGESVPDHVCYPMDEAADTAAMKHGTARKGPTQPQAGHTPVQPGTSRMRIRWSMITAPCIPAAARADTVRWPGLRRT